MTALGLSAIVATLAIAGSAMFNVRGPRDDPLVCQSQFAGRDGHGDRAGGRHGKDRLGDEHGQVDVECLS